MKTALYIVLGLIAAFLLINFIWRWISNKRSLPCPSWLGWMVELDNPIFRNNSARTIISHLDLQPDMRVLDFGCGPGRLSMPLAGALAPTGQVTALDVQPEMLEIVRAKAEQAKLTNIVYKTANPDGPSPLEEACFDLAVMVTVLGEIPDQAGAMSEVFTALKPGGVLSITEVIADPHFQRMQNVRRVAEAAGFVEEELFGGHWSYTLNFRKPEG